MLSEQDNSYFSHCDCSIYLESTACRDRRSQQIVYRSKDNKHVCNRHCSQVELRYRDNDISLLLEDWAREQRSKICIGDQAGWSPFTQPRPSLSSFVAASSSTSYFIYVEHLQGFSTILHVIPYLKRENQESTMAASSRSITQGTLQLSTKPNANLSYSFLSGGSTTKTLVVFLNGLILPKVSWERTILAIHSKLQDTATPRPHLLAYDRYGQGTSDRDPQGDHDVQDTAHDLHTFLVEFCDKEFKSKLADQQLVFVCNSIGCAVARLFAKTYPATVSGLVFLDSIMAHVDLVELWPDPDATGFDKSDLPQGTSVDDMRRVKEEYRKRFDVAAPNPEGLNRKTLAELLPEASGPKLQGNPLLTVVGHDDETFAQENEVSFLSIHKTHLKIANRIYRKSFVSLKHWSTSTSTLSGRCTTKSLLR